MNVAEIKLADHITRLLLRYFKGGTPADVTSPLINIQEDAAYLRFHWAISQRIYHLANHLHLNRDEAQASLTHLSQSGSALVKGRVSAARTVIARRVTGDSAVVCFDEPRRTFSEGPNYVLAWVLHYSKRIFESYAHLIDNSESHLSRARSIEILLAEVTRLSGIGNAITSINPARRPSSSDLRQAAMARKVLYRRAYDAYKFLRQIEAADSEALAGLLKDTLVGPLHDWQQFELLVALKMSFSLATASGACVTLLPIGRGSSSPIVIVGHYEIYWQNRSPLWDRPELEPSEVLVESILNSYRIHTGGDRPDVVVFDRSQNRVVALAEAKYSTSESGATNRFRDATTQLVRYSKLYTQTTPRENLLSQSLLAIAGLDREYCNRVELTNSPLAYSLGDLLTADLHEWAARVVQ